MKRLQETHDAIRDSSENLLPLGDLAKAVGALALSTLTILVTAFAQEWIAGEGMTTTYTWCRSEHTSRCICIPTPRS